MAKKSIAKAPVIKRASGRKVAGSKALETARTADAGIVQAQAIAQLAAAINALATAIAQHSRNDNSPLLASFAGTAAREDSPLAAAFALPSRADIRRLPPLNGEQILAAIRVIFNAPNLTLDTDLNAAIPGGPARIVAMWEMIDQYPDFRNRGLALGPNDLRFVATVRELIGVIAWGLRNALLR